MSQEGLKQGEEHISTLPTETALSNGLHISNKMSRLLQYKKYLYTLETAFPTTNWLMF